MLQMALDRVPSKQLSTIANIFNEVLVNRSDGKVPENALSIETARDYAVFAVIVHWKDIAVVPVVRIHVSHFSNIPNLQRSVVRNCVKLVVLLIKSDLLNNFVSILSDTYCDWVPMAKKSLDLGLIVQIPNANHTVFATRHQVLSIRWDGRAKNLVKVSVVLSIEFFAAEKHFFLSLQIPCKPQC